MAASAIASIIMLMVYTSYYSIVRTIQDVSAYSEFYININSAVSIIDKDISNMYIDSVNHKAGLVGDTSKSGSALSFVTINHRDYNILGDIKKTNPRSDINEVGYFLEADKEFADLFFLMRREERGFDDDILSGGNSSLILENVIDLKFEFRLRNDWTPRWDSRETKNYPSAVRTTLSVKDYKGKQENFVFLSYPNM
jgi:type II secretion system protein J